MTRRSWPFPIARIHRLFTRTDFGTGGGPLADTTVQLIRQSRVVATAKSDENGKFQVEKLIGGVYLLAAGPARSAVRAWQAGTAPPNSAKGLLLVAPGQQVRGNVNFGGITDGVFRWDEFGGLIAIPLVIGGAIAIQHTEQEERSDAS